ncbi:hypothetical protein [Streptomyces flaveolus]|uniref:hypothetical protein n=1 Tax=Streptomyces flaveolus TaxID=67297 RepID=UPI0033CDC402
MLPIGSSVEPLQSDPVAPDWYGWSADTHERGLKKLLDLGLVERRERYEKAPLYPMGVTKNIYITPLGAAILLMGIVAGCVVYKYTRTPSAGRGDIVGAIASAAAAVITVLALLLGGGNKTTSDGESPTREASITTAR